MSREYIWAEKFRPQELKDFVGNDIIRDKFQEYINNGDIPHLLLVGQNGTGKSTLAKILAQKLDCDYIYINASDENNVETVRNKIKSFATSIGFKSLKVIILDEFDYVTINAQAALRNLMEATSKHTRFILTCNYYNKIIDPIISRCQTFEVKPLDKISIAQRVDKILANENVKHSKSDVAFLINSFYPDIRKIINETQKSCYDGELNINKDKILDSDYKIKILNALKEPKSAFKIVRQIVADNSIINFIELYKFLYDRLDEMNYPQEDVILILAEHEYQDSFVVDKEITFMSAISSIINLKK